MQSQGARYITTDYPMVTSKFTAFPVWADDKENVPSYQEMYYQESSKNGKFDPVLFLKQPYFESMVSKLQLSDGSYIEGNGGTFLTFKQTPVQG